MTAPTQIAVGLAVTAGGIAHFVRPAAFEPLNVNLGFAQNTRRHVYVNGAIETAIGLTMLSPRAKTANRILSVAYPAYLLTSRTRGRRAPA